MAVMHLYKCASYGWAGQTCDGDERETHASPYAHFRQIGRETGAGCWEETLDTCAKESIKNTESVQGADIVNSCPAVEQNTRKESYWDESVDGSKESIGYETADDTTWNSNAVHDQEESQCL
jgi:hypothetical protein